MPVIRSEYVLLVCDYSFSWISLCSADKCCMFVTVILRQQIQVSCSDPVHTPLSY